MKSIEFEPFSTEGLRCVFGPLLSQARVQLGVSQREIAELTNYSARNIGKIEKGGQEPGVMTALMMVVATGCDVKAFFDKLQSISPPRE